MIPHLRPTPWCIWFAHPDDDVHDSVARRQREIDAWDAHRAELLENMWWGARLYHKLFTHEHTLPV